MNKIFTDKGFEHYVYWQTQDRQTLKRINELIKSIERDGVGEGAGKRNNSNTNWQVIGVDALTQRIV